MEEESPRKRRDRRRRKRRQDEVEQSSINNAAIELQDMSGNGKGRERVPEELDHYSAALRTRKRIPEELEYDSDALKRNSLLGKAYFAVSPGTSKQLHERAISQTLHRFDPFSPFSLPDQSSNIYSSAPNFAVNPLSETMREEDFLMQMVNGNGGLQSSSSRLDASSSSRVRSSGKGKSSGRAKRGLQRSSSRRTSFTNAGTNGGLQSSSSGIGSSLPFGATVSNPITDEAGESSIVGEVSYHIDYTNHNDVEWLNSLPPDVVGSYMPKDIGRPFLGNITRNYDLRAEDLDEVENDSEWETVPRFTKEDHKRRRFPDTSSTASLDPYDKYGVRQVPKTRHLEPNPLPNSKPVRNFNGVLPEEYVKGGKPLQHTSSGSQGIKKRHQPLKATPPYLDRGLSKRSNGGRFPYETLDHGNRRGRGDSPFSRGPGNQSHSGTSSSMPLSPIPLPTKPRPTAASRLAKRVGLSKGRYGRPGIRLPRHPGITIVSELSPYPKQLDRPNSFLNFRSPLPMLPTKEEVSIMMYDDRDEEEFELSMLQRRHNQNVQVKVKLTSTEEAARKKLDKAPDDLRKRYSAAVLLFCILTFILLPVYAAGGLDGALEWYTEKKVCYFDRDIRRQAWFWFAGEFTAIIIAITLGVVLRAAGLG